MAKNTKTQNKPGELNQQSIDYLKLTRQPFASEILTEESFFHTQALQKICDNLEHQSQFSDLILLIEGAQGSGKTCLFRYFIQQQVSNIKLLPIQAEATDTLVQIQQKMSLHLQDLGDANHLENNLQSLQTFDQTPLAIIDSCHVLSDTTLQELIRFKHEIKQSHSVNLKLLLFANSGLSDTLQKITDLQTDQIYVQELPEYSASQIENFLMHKLRLAGYSGEPLLNEKQLSHIIKKSNHTLQSYMQTAAPVIDKLIAKRLKPPVPVTKVMLISGVLVVIIATAITIYFLLPALTKTSIDVTETEDAAATVAVPVTPVKTLPGKEVISKTLTATQPGLATAIPSGADSADSTSPETETPQSITKPLPHPEITMTPLDAQSADKNVQDQEIDASVTTQHGTTEKPKLVTNTPEKKPAQEALPDSTATLTSQPIAPVSETPTSQPKPAQAVTTTKTTTAKPVTQKARTTLPASLQQLQKMRVHDASWIKQLPQHHWTLQLLGARDPETLLKYVRQHRPGNNTAWYKTWLKGKPYYVLIHGHYASRDAARASITQLPASIQKNRPWAKSIASIQKLLE